MTWAIVDLCSRHLMNILCYKLLTCSIIGCAPPDLIDSFLKSVDISSFPSDTPFRHDRDLNLISTLSQSSSPPFTKLSEPLLDLTFPLHSLLSPRLFTDPSSFVFRMASSNHAFVSCFVEYREKDEITFYRYLSVHTLFHDIFGSNLWKRPSLYHSWARVESIHVLQVVLHDSGQFEIVNLSGSS
ncbi:hypothetical protein BLNAU_7997 [Blattamonas nauphoetae]|uniref:Uncharacterized protein n=1 Tax=Blattamonas nauphoetae TaxID=2049346 RepID=A0ABQ9XZL6_9EUKA|nr:hypothetical protein BLNAU_7997 [Blattamonas nauphoetae]